MASDSRKQLSRTCTRSVPDRKLGAELARTGSLFIAIVRPHILGTCSSMLIVLKYIHFPLLMFVANPQPVLSVLDLGPRYLLLASSPPPRIYGRVFKVSSML
jgi:hypothetical protein